MPKDPFASYTPECVGVCNWPAAFQESAWLDSDKGTLDFATKTATGLTYTLSDATAFSTWSCYFYNDKDILILRSDEFHYSTHLLSMVHKCRGVSGTKLSLCTGGFPRGGSPYV